MINCLVPVVRRLNSVIHWIKLYPVDNAIRFAITYPPDGDLSVGERYPPLIQLDPGPKTGPCLLWCLVSYKVIDVLETLRYFFGLGSKSITLILLVFLFVG